MNNLKGNEISSICNEGLYKGMVEYFLWRKTIYKEIDNTYEMFIYYQEIIYNMKTKGLQQKVFLKNFNNNSLKKYSEGSIQQGIFICTPDLCRVGF